MASKYWLAATACAAMGIAGASAAPPGPKRALQPLEVDTASGPHQLKVELMSTDAEREYGLMNRQSLPRDQGMLFDFHVQQPVIFWMKDTYIPLDMIFVSKQGRVVSVKHDAKPLDKTLIESGGPTLGVLEVNAGVADAIGVKVGDLVKHAIFHPDDASPDKR